MQIRKLAMAIVLLFGAGPGARSQASAARTAIQRLYTAHNAALQKGDRKEWARWYRQHTTPDYKEKQWGGKVSTRAQVIEAMDWGAGQANMMAAMHMTVRTDVTGLRLRGDQAVVRVTERIAVRPTNPNANRATGLVRRRETWVKVGRAWKMRWSEVLSLKTLVNGIDYSRKDAPITSMADASYLVDKGRTAAVTAFAKRLLARSTDRTSWQYGDIIYGANELLGRAALREGRIGDARRYLLEAGKTPGSRQLNSFGPSNTLAREMLAKGQRETVLQYLDLVAKFWAHTPGDLMARLSPEQAAASRQSDAEHAATLAEWREVIESGQVPEEWQ